MPAPTYQVIRETGPDHKKEFEVQVLLNGQPLGIGIGTTKKNAQQKAARQAVNKLGNEVTKPLIT